MKNSFIALLTVIGILSAASCQAAPSSAAPTPTRPQPSATPTLAQTTPPASVEASAGLIVFYSDRDGNPEIYTLDTNTGSLARLTNDPAFDDSPALSPDGKQIAFQTQRDGNFEIYVMNADGSEQRPLRAARSDELWPSWGVAAPPVSQPLPCNGRPAARRWGCEKPSRPPSAIWMATATWM